MSPVSLAHKFFLLPVEERLLVTHAAVLLYVSRIAVRILPLQRLRRILIARSWKTRRLTAGVDKVAWAISAVSAHIRRPDCLSRAMTAYVLLAGTGRDPVLKIGVQQDGERRVVAHAWVEHSGQVVVGQRPDLGSYAVLLTVEPAS